MADFFQWQGDDLIVRIKVQPRASRDEIVGIFGDQLKVRITAPPVDGKANKYLMAYLSRVFKAPKSKIELLSGDSGRDKRVKIIAPKQWPDCIKKP